MLTVGSLITERYYLEAQLGCTGNRQTWLALDQKFNVLVTIKALYFGQGMEWQDFKLFEREGQTLESLRHPHIPRYQQSFRLEVPGGVYYCLIQDYIPGRSLADCVRTGQRFSESEVERIADRVLQILTYLHEQSPPVIHRDIKPSNLILGDDEQIYLVDFGAVQAGASGGGTVTIVGTYGYMPLEQFAGRTVPASDLYALGATLLCLLTGKEPAELLQENSKLHIAPDVQISRSLRVWLSQLVEPQVEKRFATAQVALQALRNKSTLVPVSAADSICDRPPNCDIRLQVSENTLDILIPQRRYGTPNAWNIVLMVFSGFQVVSTGIRFLYMIPIMGVSPVGLSVLFVSGLWLIFWGAMFRFGWKNRQRLSGFTRIQLDPEHFTISRSYTPSLTNPYQIARDKITKITSVEVTQNNPDGEICFLIHSGGAVSEQAFALGLKPEERFWLITQIRRWLKDS
jgi:serine/threonine protein kinase